MKRNLRITGAIVAAMWFSVAFAVVDAATLRFNALPNGSKIKIDGTSTIHDWTVHCDLVPGFIELQMDGAVDITGKILPDFAAIKTTPKVELNIPVRALKSDSKPMTDRMHEAMNEPQFRRIEYRLKEWSLKEAPKTAGGPAVFNTKALRAS
jgi:hypothetical protein